jgi:polyphosphate glucokinase
MEVLGIDVGGSGIKGAIVNVETGMLVSDRFRLPTPKGAKPDDMAEIVQKIIEHFKWTGKVGCGFPTIISHGVALSSGNIDNSWRNTNVKELFEEKTGLSFEVANDADAAGMAEMKFGAGKDKEGLVMIITIGTGLGSGVFYNGTLIPNFELGVIPYKNFKRWEYYASDSAKQKNDLSYIEWGKRFNKFLKMIERSFSPDLIILGGGASKKMDKFEKLITIDVPVVAANFQNNAGILGAALVAK